MGESPSMHPNLRDETQFKLNKVNKIKDCFMAEIRQ